MWSLQIASNASLQTKYVAEATVTIHGFIENSFYNDTKDERLRLAIALGEYLNFAERTILNTLLADDNLDVELNELGERRIVFERDPDKRKETDMTRLSEDFKRNEIIRAAYRAAERSSQTATLTPIFRGPRPSANEGNRTSSVEVPRMRDESKPVTSRMAKSAGNPRGENTLKPPKDANRRVPSAKVDGKTPEVPESIRIGARFLRSNESLEEMSRFGQVGSAGNQKHFVLTAATSLI